MAMDTGQPIKRFSLSMEVLRMAKKAKKKAAKKKPAKKKK